MTHALRAALAGAAVLMLGLPPARAAETPACADIAAKWEAGKATLQAPQVNALLVAASENGCVETVRTLLDAGAVVEAKDRFGNTALAHAARENRLDVMTLLLARGADVQHRSVAGNSALIEAIDRHHPAAAALLLARGADPDAPGGSGVSPLSAAAFVGDAATVTSLLAHHADPTATDRTGKAPIIYAAARGRVEIVHELLAGGVKANTRYGNALTALMWAAGHADGVPETSGVQVVTLLLTAGARVDAADNRGRTALMIAAERGHPAIIKLLLAHGADAARHDNQGKTAADLAADATTRAALGG